MMSDRQTQPGSTVSPGGGCISLGKRGEKARLHLLVHAYAIIGYLELHRYRILATVNEQRAH